MSTARAVRRDAASRRRALRLGYLNGMLWSIGNGLTTGTLVTYLAIDLGARGLGLSLLLAAPTWIGLLRILTPLLIERLGTAKRATLVFSLVSYLLIWGLPAAGAMESAPRSPRWRCSLVWSAVDRARSTAAARIATLAVVNGSNLTNFSRR
jgi:hypothetical protein